MKVLTITSVLLTALFAISCNSSGHDDQVAIELNDGQKWDVNSEMIPYVLDGEKILNAYDNSDYKDLAKKLESQNKGLVKSCTMEGKSHDELHKWLHPHMELVEALSKAKTEEMANESIAQLQESYKSYNQFFK